MNSGYYAACTGLMARTEALETIANNLANVSTVGFRANHNVFSSLLATTGNSPLSVLNQDANDYGVLSGTQLDTSQGALVKTGNTLDLAMEGPGYFVVKTDAGPVYTRGGNFRISPQAQLVTAAGDPVMGDNNLPITLIGAPISISPDGTISTNGAISGRLKMVEFPPSADIQSAGGSYYKAPPASAVAATRSQVRQGMLENSNVNPMTTAVELITAQRDVETMRHVLTMINTELDKTAAQELPRTS
ncbi:MAG TPA: flagellar basal-body rod protein FlgF [Acidobacteriaceae bacterium]|nr:flagellar basal-body rod protein FlgF [Acidobacteriaceae bacterium]